MNPLRTETVNGHVVEEYKYGIARTVYLDDRLFWGTFEDALEEVRRS